MNGAGQMAGVYKDKPATIDYHKWHVYSAVLTNYLLN